MSAPWEVRCPECFVDIASGPPCRVCGGRCCRCVHEGEENYVEPWPLPSLTLAQAEALRDVDPATIPVFERPDLMEPLDQSQT